MQLVDALAAGVRGAENGTALIYNRIGSQQIAYYQGEGGFEAQNQVAAGTAVSLDENGGAVVYVTQVAKVVCKNEDGLTVRTFTVGNYDAAVEVISPSFTGTDYATGASGVSKPVTLEQVLDAWTTSAGAPDWEVLSDGVATPLQGLISSLGGYLLSVKNFDAAGDGVTNDTSAINACIAAASSSGKVVFFPPGTYKTTSALSLPAGVSMLGCGPAKSIIKIDHASNNMFALTGTATEFQHIRGLAFGALQSWTGSIFGTTVDSLVLFEGCRFGDTNTVGVLASGYFFTDTDGIEPSFQCQDCDFVFPVNRAGTLATYVTSTAQITLKLLGCRLDWANLDSNPPLSRTYRLFLVGCTLDVTAMSVNSSSGFVSDYMVAVGNFVTNTGGATLTVLSGSGATVYEAGNYVGADVTWLANGPSAASLATRVGKTGHLTQSGGGTLNLMTEDYGQGILNNSVVVVNITDNTAFSLTANVLDGLEFDLVLRNSVAGATGTITYDTTYFAGQTATNGTAPPVSMAAQGTFISIKFRGFTGPDGLRYYPIGGSYGGT